MKEEKIVELAKSGDLEAVETLINNYKKLVTSIAFSYYIKGGDILDLTQEGMIGLYKAIKNFSADKNVPFEAYARVCVSRQIFSAIKSANANKNSPLNDAVSIEEIIEPSGLGPEDEVIREEAMEELQQKIDNLTQLEQDVLQLFLDKKSYDEIASSLNISTKAVDNALQRLKKKLKKQ